MIGQTKLLHRIDKQIEDGTFPHFSIIRGNRGSGKFMVANYIADRLGAGVCVSEKSVEAVRDVVSVAEKLTVRMVYVFQRAEDLSAQAVNAMLKTLEEPPENVYFIFTTRNDQLLLDTIKSRGTMYTMNQYSKKDLLVYNDKRPVPDFCKTPYDLDMYNRNAGFDDFVQLVVDNVGRVPLTNAMKIADRVDLDGTDDSKFDMGLFFEAFKYYCFESMKNQDSYDMVQMYYEWMSITVRYQKDALRTSANVKMLFAMWLMDIRQVSVV